MEFNFLSFRNVVWPPIKYASRPYYELSSFKPTTFLMLQLFLAPPRVSFYWDERARVGLSCHVYESDIFLSRSVLRYRRHFSAFVCFCCRRIHVRHFDWKLYAVRNWNWHYTTAGNMSSLRKNLENREHFVEPRSRSNHVKSALSTQAFFQKWLCKFQTERLILQIDRN